MVRISTVSQVSSLMCQNAANNTCIPKYFAMLRRCDRYTTSERMQGLSQERNDQSDTRSAPRPTPSVKSMAESWTLLFFLVLWAVNVSSCKVPAALQVWLMPPDVWTGFEDLYIHACSGSAVQAVWWRDAILFVDVIAVFVSSDSLYFCDCPDSSSGRGAKC